jgi:molybdopterin-guanine dinucleotide biosynthesis adapter protein
METTKSPPVIIITGRSGSGKTTLIERLIARYARHGLRVAVVKHMRHDFDIDHPGKDTHRYREAGARISAITNDRSMAIIAGEIGELDPLDAAAALFARCDLVIVEGHKEEEDHPKIEVIGDSAEAPLYCAGVGNIVALACDTHRDTSLPVFRRNDVDAIADYIGSVLGLTL